MTSSQNKRIRKEGPDLCEHTAIVYTPCIPLNNPYGPMVLPI